MVHRPKASFYFLAAAAGIAAAVVAYQTIAAAAAEQNQQNDDPAPVTAKQTVITHIKYLHEKISEGLRAAHSMVFPGQENVQSSKPASAAKAPAAIRQALLHLKIIFS